MNLGLTSFPVAESLPVICHELGHVVRNHLVKQSQWYRFSPSYDQALNNYIQQTYNPLTRLYRHNSVRFAALKSLINSEAAPIYERMRKDEAEADVLGAQVCASIRLDPDEYMNLQQSCIQSIDRTVRKSQRYRAT